MKKLSVLSIFLIAVICLFYVNKNRWKGDGGDSWKTIICSDGHGYYAYLPCIFIYHQFDYEKVMDEETKLHPWLHDNMKSVFPVYDGKQYDKCFAGVAVLLLPFFLLSLLFSHILGFDPNGYSVLFQTGVSIGALFYLVLGLLFIRKLLKVYNLNEAVIGVVLISVVFATNLFYYSTIEPSMAHTYSFGLMAVFIYYLKKAMNDFKLKYIVFSTITMCLLFITRPTNILVLLFLPFLAGNYNTLKLFFKNIFRLRVLSVVIPIALVIAGIQLILWHIQTGHYFIWSYQRATIQQSESFDFTNPHFFGILFSFTNGWFIYTPIMFLSLVGLITLFKQNMVEFSGFLLFFVVTTYILSSWWCWSYGGFGLRAYIDFYPVFVLPLAKFIDFVKAKWARLLILLFTLLCISLNLIQTYQFRTGIITNADMDREKYEKSLCTFVSWCLGNK